MAGQKLSALEAVDIEIQLSPSGQPGRASATWVATVENVIPSADATVSVVLRVKEAVSE
jgi:cytochrome c-type biogenesis protein CcmH